MNNGTSVDLFEKFVEANLISGDKNTKPITHVRYDKGKILKYSFTGPKYSKFLKLYANKLENGSILNFVEKPNVDNVTQLVIKVDISQSVSNRTYAEEHIDSIVSYVNKILKKDFWVTPSEVSAYVVENSAPRSSKSIYRDSFSIYYPYIPMDTNSRLHVLNKLNKTIKSILKGIPFKNSDIIDKNISNLRMFGDSQYLSTIYDINAKRIDNPNEYDYETILNLLSMRQYDLESCIKHKENVELESKDVVDQVDLDQVDQVDQFNVLDELGLNSDDGQNNNREYEEYSNSNSNSDNGSSESTQIKQSSIKTIPHKNIKGDPEKAREIELAKRLIQIIKTDRSKVEKDWMRIGFALYSVSYTLFPIFNEFSAQNPKGFSKSPQDIWKNAPKFCKNYSIDTLRRWAFLDNEDKYYNILKNVYRDLFEDAETCQHVDLAALIYALYRDRFVCVDIAKNKWYEFQGHKWVLVQSAYTLEEIISDDVRYMMKSYCRSKMKPDKSKKKGQSNNDDFKKLIKLMQGVDNLGNVNFRSNVVRACTNKFFDKEFQSKLDTDAYLVGFENGVYDLQEMSFRDGMPSDLISKTVGYDYVEFVESDTIFKDIMKFFSQVHTESDMLEYTLTFLASILRGKPDQKAHIWIGVGGNGKSATVDLIKRMIGDYFGVLPVTVLTCKKKSSSGPSPETADKYGKRFLVIQEPEHNDTIYVGQMKELTGEDTLYARALYGDPFEYVPMFSIVLTCNNLPHIPSTDRGTWRRLRVTPYDSEFVSSNPVGPKQFIGDETLKEKFDDWVQPLIWLLLNKYYPIFKEGVDGKQYTIKTPEIVTLKTNDYKKDSDYYIEFLEESFKFTKDETDTESISFVYDAFVAWYKSSYGGQEPPRKRFVEYLEKNKIKHDKQNILGIKYALSLV